MDDAPLMSDQDALQKLAEDAQKLHERAYGMCQYLYDLSDKRSGTIAVVLQDVQDGTWLLTETVRVALREFYDDSERFLALRDKIEHAEDLAAAREVQNEQ